MLGPRGQALVGALVGQFKLSHRDVVMFFASVLGVVMSPGTVARMLFRVSEAVASSVEAAKKLARQQAVAHADETSWRQGRRTSWRWAMATAIATIFEVAPDRSRRLPSQHKHVLRTSVGRVSGCAAARRPTSPRASPERPIDSSPGGIG